MYAEIAIPKTNLDTLTYSIPAQFESLTNPGSLVKIKLKERECFGIIIEKNKTTSIGYAKDIIEVIDSEFLSKDLLDLIKWAKRYYFAKWGQVLNLTIPQSVYKYKLQSLTANHHLQPAKTILAVFEEQKAESIKKIIYALKNNFYKTFLLHQSRNANPQEIYLRLIQETLNLKKSVIMLVPEIVLTPKFIDQFKEHFGDYLFCFHSGLKLSERKKIWHTVKQLDYSIVLGTRSAIFAPVKNLGLIIVDNEHDLSYKEIERQFHYNARDVALVRARISKAVTVLSSSTPACESFYNAKTNKYELISIPDIRIQNLRSSLLLIDMRRSKDKILSAQLKYEIKSVYNKGKQIVLFLNRRGFARVLTCSECGYVPTCPQCGIPLVYHNDKNLFSCHICKHSEPVFDFCPRCKGNDFTYQGTGTQKIEFEIKKIIRNPDILRVDSDSKNILKLLIKPIRRIKATEEKSVSCRVNPWLQKRIIIATRLGLSGLDYSRIGLFAIISADTTLFLPDFRAQERTFQEISRIIEQCSVNKECKVMIQSYHPDNFSIYRAVQGNYLKFYEQELEMRKKLSYPPFTRLSIIRISSQNPEHSEKAAGQIAKRLSQIKNITILGPSPTPHPRKPRIQTYQLLIKINPNQSLSNLISRKDLLETDVDIDIDIDIDPI